MNTVRFVLMIVDTKLRIKFDITTLCLIGFIYCSIGEIYFACKSKERGHSLVFYI